MDLNKVFATVQEASRELLSMSDREINQILLAVADAALAKSDFILAENKKDLERMDPNDPKYDRLKLTVERLQGIAADTRNVATLPSPVGRTLKEHTHPQGMRLRKVSVPFGVIGIIYEARPNVSFDVFSLCLKSGNAVILRGGKEAIHSNIAISDIMREAVKSVGLDENVIQLVHDTSRESSTELMRMKGTLDCLIPRGSKRLIQAVVENASVPVIETGSGNCHIYVDESADINMAANIIFNAKTQRIGVCNACESLVIHENIIKKALPAIKARLDEKNVTIRGDEKAREACPGIEAASEEDFGTEYLDYIISVKTVSSLDEAIAHINKYSTGHSEAIITENKENADKFMMLIDSSSVYHNASTRFTDGGEFGLGAEIGISTQKLHARGPMGLRELTTTKYLVYGDGQIR